MTKEEIIRNLKYTMEKHKNDTVNTFDINISAMCKDILDYLEQELCEDAISRKELLRIYEDRFLELQKLKHLKDNKGAEDRQMGVNYCINILKEMPLVTPKPKTDVLDKIRAEIEEVSTYDGVYIDRAYVLEIIDKYKAEREEEKEDFER